MIISKVNPYFYAGSQSNNKQGKTSFGSGCGDSDYETMRKYDIGRLIEDPAYLKLEKNMEELEGKNTDERLKGVENAISSLHSLETKDGVNAATALILAEMFKLKPKNPIAVNYLCKKYIEDRRVTQEGDKFMFSCLIPMQTRKDEYTQMIGADEQTMAELEKSHKASQGQWLFSYRH